MFGATSFSWAPSHASAGVVSQLTAHSHARNPFPVPAHHASRPHPFFCVMQPAARFSCRCCPYVQVLTVVVSAWGAQGLVFLATLRGAILPTTPPTPPPPRFLPRSPFIRPPETFQCNERRWMMSWAGQMLGPMWIKRRVCNTPLPRSVLRGLAHTAHAYFTTDCLTVCPPSRGVQPGAHIARIARRISCKSKLAPRMSP